MPPESRTASVDSLAWTIRFVLLTLLATPLLASTSFFPVTFPQERVFAAGMGVVAALYAFLVVRRPEYLPAPSPILTILAALFGIGVISAAVGVSPYRSWWGDGFWVDGLFVFAGLIVFVVIAGAVVRGAAGWCRFLFTSVWVSAAAGLVALAQAAGFPLLPLHADGRVTGTIGNAALLAAYLASSVLLGLWLLAMPLPRWAKGVVGVGILIDAAALMVTKTRSSIFLLAFVLAAVALGWVVGLIRQRRWRPVIGIVVAGAAVFALAFWWQPTFGRGRAFSWSDPSVRLRVLEWQAAWSGFVERPLLGFGPGNYATVFNRHFDPAHYALSLREPWTTRAHNTLLEIAATYGVFGAAAYLALIVVVGGAVWRAYRTGTIRRRAAWFGTLFIGFSFLQGNFIFDSFGSLLLWFLVLAYLHAEHRSALLLGSSMPRAVQVMVAVALASLAAWFVVVHSLKPLFANLQFERAFRLSRTAQRGAFPAAVRQLEGALAVSPLYAGDYVIDLVETESGMLGSTFRSEDRAEVERAFRSLIRELSAAFVRDPTNAWFALRLGNLNLTATAFDRSKLRDARSSFEEAHRLAPRRVEPLLWLAQVATSEGELDRALAYLDEARRLAPNNPDVSWQRWQVHARSDESALARSAAREAIEHHYVFRNRDEVLQVARLFEEANDYPTLITLYRAASAQQVRDATLHLGLARAYAAVGEYGQAGAEAAYAARLDPQYQADAAELLEEIRMRSAAQH